MANDFNVPVDGCFGEWLGILSPLPAEMCDLPIFAIADDVVFRDSSDRRFREERQELLRALTPLRGSHRSVHRKQIVIGKEIAAVSI
jgi:hypothetical protein